MRAVWRLGMAVAAAGLWLGQAPALAQSAPATTNTPAADSIGPRELQNFSLQGTVTRPSDTTPAPAPRTRPSAPAPALADASSSSGASSQTVARVARAPERLARQPAPQPPALAATTNLQPPAPAPLEVNATPAPASLPSVPAEAPATLAPERSLPLWPWLLATLALGAGGAFLFWRRSNAREAYAGGPQIDAFTAPEPQPRAPAPPPAAPPAPPKPVGIVSSNMRPWIEIGFTPLRCIVDTESVTFEFELQLFNSGSIPARNVLVMANLLNASPTQDQEIGQFFAGMTSEGERIAAIQPLQSFTMRPHVSMPIDQARILEAGDRRVFVPLIAFNVVYGSGDSSRTSAAYLLGRETKGDKLAPFRLDLGPRIFRGLGARQLPISVRR